jgi:very-short-patch-repair endonuclease/DNA-directed RNA polymerase subunit H (RpoH/RPB5)
MNEYITFESAHEIVKKLTLSNTIEWRNWIKDNKQYKIPYNPDIYYKNSGWINWKHFLNKDFKLNFISYLEAKEILKKYNIKNNIEFKNWIKDNKQYKIPKAPQITYKEKGWISWGDFLSTDNVYKKNFIEYKKAVEILKKYNLKNQIEYISLIKNKKIELPTNPHTYYKEWISWNDYLSSDTINNFNKEFINYEESKEILKYLNIKNVKDFLKRRPNNIPVNPNSHYKDEWISWGEYLGTNRNSNKVNGQKFLKYEEAKSYLKNLDIKHKYDYIDYINKYNIDFLPKRPDYIYKDKWCGYLEYLNCESLRTSYGERKIKSYLDNNKINYVREMKFNSCKNIKELPFDFYLPEYNICIEYDGQHHFNIVSKFGGENFLNKVRQNDKIKDNWCSENNIKLIRISYKKKNKIFKILNIEIN